MMRHGTLLLHGRGIESAQRSVEVRFGDAGSLDDVARSLDAAVEQAREDGTLRVRFVGPDELLSFSIGGVR
jgi:hypothetical protein